MRLNSHLLRWLSLCLAMLALPVAAQQGSFSPRMIVDGRAITNYEVAQRRAFLEILQAPDASEEEALRQLVDDRLRLVAAKRMNLSLTAEQVAAGMAEFAARANLTTEQFVAAIGQAGVSAESFRDFVSAGLLWREVARTKFLPAVAVSEAEVDRALQLTSRRAGVTRVLISELVVPVPVGKAKVVRDEMERIRAEAQGASNFAAAARKYSTAPTAAEGGALGWAPVGNVTPAVLAALSGLQPGQVSQVVELPNALGIYLLRAIDQTQAGDATPASVDYALYTVANAAEAAQVEARVDRCDDLYGVAKGQPAERLSRQTQPAASLPADIAQAVQGLDDGETTVITRGGVPTVLMLCQRTAEGEAAPDRGAVRQRLLNERIGALAEGYLEELRSDAVIREP